MRRGNLWMNYLDGSASMQIDDSELFFIDEFFDIAM